MTASTHDEDVTDAGASTPDQDVTEAGASTPDEDVTDAGASTPDEDVTDAGASTPDEDVTEAGASTPDEDAAETGTVLAATHHVPEGGIDWWSEPDPERAADGTLDGFVPVQVLEETTGWARVRASNGWEGWVDAGLLVAGDTTKTALLEAPSAPSASSMGRGARISIGLTIAGAVIAIAGSFLPWFSEAGADVTAWDIRVVALFTREPTDVSLDVGPIVLITALSVIALVLRRPLPAWAALALAGVPLVLGVAGLAFYADLPGSGADLGIGLLATLAGAVVMLVGVAVSPRMLPGPSSA